MNAPSLLGPRPERLFVGVALAVVLAVAFNLWTQRTAVPARMRYVPPGAIAYVVSAPLKSLWAGFSPHLKGYFAAPLEGREPTAVQALARDLVDGLDKKGIVLRRATDLDGLGIAAEEEAALALIDHDGSPHLLLALPVSNRDRFEKTVSRYTGKQLIEQPLDAAHGAARVFGSDSGLRLAFGDDGTAVISDDAGLLRRVLAGQADNLVYYQSSDWHHHGLTVPLPGRQSPAGAWLRGSMRMPALAALIDLADTPAALFGNVEFAVAADERALDLQARGALPDGGAEAIARLLVPPPERHNTVTAVLSRSEAAVSIGDHSLPYFLRYLSSDSLARPLAGLNRLFPGLLQTLGDLKSLDELSVAASDPLARVPGTVVGLRMAAAEADDLVLQLQRALRLKRDREVLRLAAERYRAQSVSASSDAAPDVAVPALLDAGLLSNEADPLWSRYASASADATPKPALVRGDFDKPSYVRRGSDGVALHYLMPPVTDDDVRYRFADRRNDIQVADLKRDKYRLCSTYDGSTLWLGNDAEVLGGWMGRLSGGPLTTDYADAMQRHVGLTQAKLDLLLLPRQLLESSQLYPDDQVNKAASEALADIQQYHSALLVLTPHPTEREIHVLVSFNRR